MDVPPAWMLLPFGCYLLSIATLPLFLPRFWESNRNKLLVALAVSTPVLVFLLSRQAAGGHMLWHGLREYLAFMSLLAALFVISGGVHLRGSLSGTPLVNTLA